MRIISLILLLLLLVSVNVFAQSKTDSSINALALPAASTQLDTLHFKIKLPVKSYQSALNNLLSANRYLDTKEPAVSFSGRKKQRLGKEYLFYLLSIIFLMFGVFKIFYSKYVNDIFRVFFNTSLRQNQLTDLLLQARLPSLIFNIFFTISGGLYVWLLLIHYYFNDKEYNSRVLLLCIAAIACVYIIRYCVLKLIGWISETETAWDTYIFVIFLINKIVGITLIPFIIFLAFAPPFLITGVVNLSFIVLIIFLLMRFFRAYSLLQPQVHFNRLHFFMFTISLEILPLLVLYKVLFNVILK